MAIKTREEQYQADIELVRDQGLTPLGLMTNQAWNDDPKHLAFTAARYKFVAKMLAGKKNVLEVGCADAFFTRIVVQDVISLTATDFDPVFISDVEERSSAKWKFKTHPHDFLSGPFQSEFDAAYALDVIEHIHPSDEYIFVNNIVRSLTVNGFLILGSPSFESQKYASHQSVAGHVNCKTGPEFRALFEHFFHNVFLFSMNDEVVHTGYAPMAHYRLAIGCNRKI
jgi:2-polyprenyl-3-methyl-5-hydroxy-6-metoxy-1,4-benzoquinol methylase